MFHSIMVSIDEAKNFITNYCGVPSYKLDSAGDLAYDSTDWRVGKYNGPPGYLKKFIPPNGWTAVGLKVLNCYDGGNNDWLGTSNSNGEWYIGYHGVKTTSAIYNICNDGFKKGPGQDYQNHSNTNSLNNSYLPKCGIGSYFAQNIDQAASYSSPISYNGKDYKVVFMCRINPHVVRISNLGIDNDYMITNGDYNTKNEARPYRILVKN